MKNLNKNNREIKIGLKTVLTIFIALLTFSCHKSDSPAPLPASLSSISPTSGPKTTVVTINGANFGTSLPAVQVFFNNVEATVQAVTDTQITAIVPARAYTGLVKVVVNGTELTGPEFTYLITDIQVSTFAGSGTAGLADGTGTAAQFGAPFGITIDTQGNLYVAGAGSHKIRKITPSGVVSTLAGSGASGFADGTGTAAQFHTPAAVAVDAQGNVYVADLGNHKIRKITPSGVVSTFAGSTVGFADGTGASAQFNSPEGIAVDTQGNLYISDNGNYKIRKITPSGVVSTLAGSTVGFADGIGTAAQFDFPTGITVDAQGNVYVSDSNNNKIRKITPSGVVSTFAGSTAGFANGTGTSAKFSSPYGLTMDAQGNLYVGDGTNYKIRKITPSGVVSTLAGGSQGFANGTGTTAQFELPTGVVVDTQNNLYVADYSDHKIRKITQE